MARALITCCCGFVLGVVTPAHAQVEAGATAAVSAEAIGHANTKAAPGNNGISASFKPQGQGRLRFVGLHIYDAQLWSGSPVTSANYTRTPLALTLTYARTLYGQAIADRSLKEMQGVATLNDTQASTWLAAMRDTFPDVREGDQLTGVYQPGQPAVFWLNGQLLGPVGDGEFAAAFFGIWLDARSSEPALRKQLLTPP